MTMRKYQKLYGIMSLFSTREPIDHRFQVQLKLEKEEETEVKNLIS